MARLGLGDGWKCLFANDISPKKTAAYLANFPDAALHFHLRDIRSIEHADLPGRADLIWGSFPCQDLSLAGSGKGVFGVRSSLVWKLLDLCEGLGSNDRMASLLVLENVSGLLSSNQGKDFYLVLSRLQALGYIFGTLLMDALRFLPQSRRRVFLVAAHPDRVTISPQLVNGRVQQGISYPWTSAALDGLFDRAPFELKRSWVWWNLKAKTAMCGKIDDLIDENASDLDSADYTRLVLSLMTDSHRNAVERLQEQAFVTVGTLYRRTRVVDGVRQQRAEPRFDGVSGCLRTPAGGSSRQRLILVGKDEIRTRLMTPLELARLMGLPLAYKMPANYNDAYHVAGDGLVVPVVSWLTSYLLEPLLGESERMRSVAKAEFVFA